jgi:hypothetical protein
MSGKENLEYQTLRHNKLWFDVKGSKLIDQWKQGTLQFLQNSSQISSNNMQSLRRETNRIFRKM